MRLEDEFYVEEDEKSDISLDASIFHPRAKDILKTINNELKKPEYARYTLEAYASKSNDVIHLIPMAKVKDNEYIFKVNNMLKKIDIKKLDFICKK